MNHKTETDLFQIVGAHYQKQQEVSCQKMKWYKEKPILSFFILLVIVLGCIGCKLVMNHDPLYMDLSAYNQAPDAQHFFGTDSLGRDIFSMIWYGGRNSILIGAVSTIISTGIAIIYGTLSASSKSVIDSIMMRFTDILLSIPSILLIIFTQAMIGRDSIFAIAIIIGITCWMSIAKMVRTEVKIIYQSEFVQMSRCMGGGFFHILQKHLMPNFLSTIMFMVVMNFRSSIIAESTLSFLGIGLPIEEVSWGSMLSLSEKALLTNSWWVIVIPGIFLIATLLCITNIGNYMRKQMNQKESNL